MNHIRTTRGQIYYPLILGKRMNEHRMDDVSRRTSIFPMGDNNDVKRAYTEITAGNWKRRFYNHRYSFSNQQLESQRALSK